MSAESIEITLAAIDAMMRAMADDDRDRVANEFVRQYGNELSLDDAPDLKPDEWRVLRDTDKGLTNREIAYRMNLSTKAVYAIKARIKAKLGAPNFVAALTAAYRKGML